MIRLRQLQSIVVVLFCIAAGSFAAEVSSPRVGHAPGLLGAIREGSRPGFVCEPGQTVPDDCQLFSSGSGPSLIELPRGTVHIAPDSRLRVKANGGEVVLTSGRVFVQARQPIHVIVADGLRIKLSDQCGVELTVERDKPVEVYVLPGAAVENPCQRGLHQQGREGREAWTSDCLAGCVRCAKRRPQSIRSQRVTTGGSAKTAGCLDESGEARAGPRPTGGQRFAVGLAGAVERCPIPCPRRPATAGGAGGRSTSRSTTLTTGKRKGLSYSACRVARRSVALRCMWRRSNWWKAS